MEDLLRYRYLEITSTPAHVPVHHRRGRSHGAGAWRAKASCRYTEHDTDVLAAQQRDRQERDTVESVARATGSSDGSDRICGILASLRNRRTGPVRHLAIGGLVHGGSQERQE